VLSTRARKEVALADVKVQVCVYAFDCLYHNGASLLHEPLTKRRELLHASLVEVPGQLAQATTKISNDVEELEVGGTVAIYVSFAVQCRHSMRLLGATRLLMLLGAVYVPYMLVLCAHRCSPPTVTYLPGCCLWLCHACCRHS
jgi:hypothetical protein